MTISNKPEAKETKAMNGHFLEKGIHIFLEYIEICQILLN